jgi:hypothetical protein
MLRRHVESAGKKRARDSRTTRRFRRMPKRIDLLLAKSPFGLSDGAAGFFVSRKTRAARLAREFLFFAICLVAEIDRSADRMSVLFRRDARLEETSSSDARGRTKRERRRRESDAT